MKVKHGVDNFKTLLGCMFSNTAFTEKFTAVMLSIHVSNLTLCTN
jgi:hypothetical protein